MRKILENQIVSILLQKYIIASAKIEPEPNNVYLKYESKLPKSKKKRTIFKDNSDFESVNHSKY